MSASVLPALQGATTRRFTRPSTNLIVLSALSALLWQGPLPAQPSNVDDITPANLLEENPAPDSPAEEPVVIDLTPVTREAAPPEPASGPEQPAPPATQPSPENIETAPPPVPPIPADTAPATPSDTPPAPPERSGALTVEEVIGEIRQAEANEPPPTPQPKVLPQSHGDTSGTAHIGHRAVVDRYAGWGWIKEEGGAWNRSQWAVIEEVPGDMPVPGRFLEHPNNDDNTQYKLYGEWTDYKAYEPNYDVFVPVFKLRGFELIGPAAKPAGVRPPRGTNMSGSSNAYPGGGGARNNPFNR